MPTEPVIVEREGPVAVVTLNNPSSRNALSGPVIDAFLAFLEEAKGNSELGCIVLTGAGEGFSSGGDLRDMHAASHPMFRGAPHEMQEGYRNNIQRIPATLETFEVPVIAAVNGVASGAGCDLACMCDIRIGSPKAKFVEGFLRLGLISGDGGAWHLPRVVGLPRALEMALTCDPIDAGTALGWGLLNRVVPEADLLAEATAMARKICDFPPLAIRMNKRLIRRSLDLDLRQSLEMAAAFQAILQHTGDFREAVAAFIEKRTPRSSSR